MQAAPDRPVRQIFANGNMYSKPTAQQVADGEKSAQDWDGLAKAVPHAA